MKQAILMLACIAMSFTAMAQIGYQVSLLDQDTGAPRAYELITAIIELTDNDGNVICSEDGVIIGKSQVLTVPVAEYAKRTHSLSKGILCSKTWHGSSDDGYDGISYTFYLNGTFSRTTYQSRGEKTFQSQGNYEIDGNFIILYSSSNGGEILKYSSSRKSILAGNGLECF